MKLKVCGMRDPANISGVAAMKPDFMGFIFYPPSPRYADPAALEPILKSLDRTIRKVGVFVNETPEHMISVGTLLGLQDIQLHGNESPETCARMREAGFGVIKVFHVSEEADIERTVPYEAVADYFLFDTRTPQYGGSGKQFDRNLLVSYRSSVPYLLSGGIGPEDIDGLRGIPVPAGIDVNSRVEISPGLKDLGRIQHLLTEIARFS
jgi:phosphoribosylanthranilate isomerase